ncbi:hypothetical protein AB0B94_00750 [Micromonospora sp. NPDC048986]|uniref:hypothetical protein n=1 Tax=Micromonospora sp. NPDC048986 TaxID=3155644 RepID=UPI0033D8EFA1
MHRISKAVPAEHRIGPPLVRVLRLITNHLAALEHHLGLARESDLADDSVVRFHDDLNIIVRLRNGAEVGASVRPDPDKKETGDATLQLHTNRLARDVLGRSTTVWAPLSDCRTPPSSNLPGSSTRSLA